MERSWRLSIFIIRIIFMGGLQVPFHWHKEIEIIWVEQGQLELTLGTQHKVLKERDFVMINSYELHQLQSIGNTASIHHALVFLPDMLSFSYPDQSQLSFLKPLLSHQLRLPSYVSGNHPCASSIRKTFLEILHDYDTRPMGWTLFFKSNLYRILGILVSENLLVQTTVQDSQGKNREAQYKQILRYIHKHYDQKIYLEDLAASLNMNPQYFCRFFKKQFQMTPVAYINYYRTLQAADLLKHTSYRFWKSDYGQDLKIQAILRRFSGNILTVRRKNTACIPEIQIT